MGEVELPIGGESGACEVAGADDGCHWLESVRAAHRKVTVEDVALGVEEPLLVSTNSHHIPAQEGNQILHRAEGRLVERGGVQLLNQARGCPGPEAHRFAVLRLRRLGAGGSCPTLVGPAEAG